MLVSKLRAKMIYQYNILLLIGGFFLSGVDAQSVSENCQQQNGICLALHLGKLFDPNLNVLTLANDPDTQAELENFFVKLFIETKVPDFDAVCGLLKGDATPLDMALECLKTLSRSSCESSAVDVQEWDFYNNTVVYFQKVCKCSIRTSQASQQMNDSVVCFGTVAQSLQTGDCGAANNYAECIQDAVEKCPELEELWYPENAGGHERRITEEDTLIQQNVGMYLKGCNVIYIPPTSHGVLFHSDMLLLLSTVLFSLWKA